MHPDRLIETPERDFTEILERQALADAQFGDHVGNETLLWLRMRAKPRRELDRRPEEIVMVLDRLARGSTDAHLDRNLFCSLLVLGQRILDPVRATRRCRGRHEGRHDSIPGMLHLAA